MIPMESRRLPATTERCGLDPVESARKGRKYTTEGVSGPDCSRRRSVLVDGVGLTFLESGEHRRHQVLFETDRSLDRNAAV